MNYALKSEDPFVSLTDIIYNSTKHGDVMKDAAGNRVEGHECKDCCKRLSDSLMRRIRGDKSLGMRREMAALNTAVNQRLNGVMDRLRQR